MAFGALENLIQFVWKSSANRLYSQFHAQYQQFTNHVVCSIPWKVVISTRFEFSLRILKSFKVLYTRIYFMNCCVLIPSIEWYLERQTTVFYSNRHDDLFGYVQLDRVRYLTWVEMFMIFRLQFDSTFKLSARAMLHAKTVYSSK